MKQLWLAGWLMGMCIWIAPENRVLAQTNRTAVPSAKVATNKVDFLPELETVTAQLKAAFDTGKTNTAELQEQLAAINALMAKHLKDGNREQLARLYLLDAHIYADGLNDNAKARAIRGQVIRDFPGTLAAKGAAIALARDSIPEGLAVGQKFPEFSETDVAGNALATSAYRGHVTLIDFWATWCGPCKAEMPNVIATYQGYHAKGFEIIGVSLDSDRDRLVAFTQAANMPWAQYFDGQEWHNKLAQKYNVDGIPMNYLLDRYGIIAGKDLRGAALAKAVAKALASY